jgi:hypothetical protein
MPCLTYRHLLRPLAAACLLAATGAQAAVDAVVQQALDLQAQGNSAAAYDLLEPLEVDRAGDPDFDTVFGILGNETEHFSRAIMALERVLAVQPAHPRVRAELGRALFAVGDNKSARELFEDAKKGDVPPGAALTIDQFLSAIERAEDAGRSAVRGYIEAGIGYDTNVNSGPANGNVAVPAFGGAILKLDASGVKLGSAFGSLSAGLTGRHVLDPRWSLIGAVSATTRPNADHASQLNTSQLDGNAGVSWRHERNEITAVAQVGTFTLDGSQFRQSAGGTAEWIYRIDGFRQWNSYLQYARLHYPTQPTRDVNRTVVGTSYAHQFKGGNLAFGGVYAGAEQTTNDNVDQLGHHLFGMRGGLQVPVGSSVAAFASFGFENRIYGGSDPFFLVRRHDKQGNASFGLLWEPAPRWRVTPQIGFTRVSSNSPISDFNKAVFSVTARREF